LTNICEMTHPRCLSREWTVREIEIDRDGPTLARGAAPVPVLSSNLEIRASFNRKNNIERSKDGVETKIRSILSDRINARRKRTRKSIRKGKLILDSSICNCE